MSQSALQCLVIVERLKGLRFANLDERNFGALTRLRSPEQPACLVTSASD
jgi:hypothetical protein